MPADSNPLDGVDGHEHDSIHQPHGTRQDDQLDSVVVRYTDEPDQRTVFPADATDFDRTTTWFTARADAFVDLADTR